MGNKWRHSLHLVSIPGIVVKVPVAAFKTSRISLVKEELQLKTEKINLIFWLAVVEKSKD